MIHKITIILIHLVSILLIISPSSFSPDLSPVTIMTTLDDVVKLLQLTEEKRAVERTKDKEELAIEKVKDKIERAEEIDNLTKNITGLIKIGVKEEVESALLPVKESQTALQEEHTKLAATVALLQKQVLTIQATAPSQENHGNSSIPQEHTENRGAKGALDTTGKNVITGIVRAAKRVLGLSPITNDHIEQAKSEYTIIDEDEAKIAAIKDVLYFEMKIPESKIKSLKITRVFRSTTHPDRLYAEFEEESVVHYIYSFARFLSHGIHLHMYIPHSFFQRYLAIKNIEYPIRKAPGNIKTKIKFGIDDLFLIKRDPTDPHWITVPLCLDALPPVDLSNPSQPSSSPAIGRSRSAILKRKERSPPESSLDQLSKSSRSTSPLLDHSDQTKNLTSNFLSTQEEYILEIENTVHTEKDTTLIEVEQTKAITPTKTDLSLSSSIDIGSFKPSACFSPITASNKNFTFGTGKSNIPTMKSLLNC